MTLALFSLIEFSQTVSQTIKPQKIEGGVVIDGGTLITPSESGRFIQLFDLDKETEGLPPFMLSHTKGEKAIILDEHGKILTPSQAYRKFPLKPKK